MNSEESLRFFHLAMNHMLLPMAVEAIEEKERFPYYVKRAKEAAQTQACRSADFVLLYDYLLEKGLKPLVIKGIVCRSLYPHPEERCSSDEDLWIDSEAYPALHEALLAYGLKLVDSNQNIEESFEVTYEEKESHLYIEVHKTLFPPSSAYSYLNAYFENAQEKAIAERIYRTGFYTLSHTDHLLYLILHAFKHFLHSGFGIRQVGDILLYSISYQNDIEWSRLQEDLRDARAFDLSRAIYKIGMNRIINDKDLRDVLKDWDIDAIDENKLLEDIMQSGIYGASSLSRLHSSTMTINAINRKSPTSILSSVFLPLSSMENKYQYLKKRPYLLPIAWISRVVVYLKETRNMAQNDPQESIRLGKKRIELLKEYKILEEES